MGDIAASGCARIARVLAIGGCVALAGCGLRTDPLFTGPDTDFGMDASAGTGDVIIDPARMGACGAPFEIPIEDTTIQGTLPDGHGSLYGGWCGADEGVEDVYRLVPFYDVDVTFTFRPESTAFTPTLRVQADPCGDTDSPIPVCAQDPIDVPYHFLARNGVTYYVTIDSRNPGEGGDYAFDVTFGDPGIAACVVHPERIMQAPGAAFIWGNELNGGQGRIDGFCSAPGRENMFQIDATYEGGFYAVVEGTGGFVPVLSVRSGCGGVTELLCVESGNTGLPGTAEMYGFLGPGTWFLNVDQATNESGGYSLRVEFQ